MVTVAEAFWQSFAQSIEANILLFSLAMILFAALFIITKQSMSSTLLLGIVAMDGIERIANEPVVTILYNALKILVFGLIGYAIATTVFKK